MSVKRSVYIPEHGLIYIDFNERDFNENNDPGDILYIAIRYKGKEQSIEERNHKISEYYYVHKMTNDHIMYDIKHRTYNKEPITTDEFYIINTNIIIRIQQSTEAYPYRMQIDVNGMHMFFYINSKRTYEELINNFKMAITEIQNKHLNSVNMANFTLPNNVQGSIGAFLTGQNGSIAQQRTMIQQQQEQQQEQQNILNRMYNNLHPHGGQRKLRKSHKLRKSRKK